jgi:hypothetical protein
MAVAEDYRIGLGLEPSDSFNNGNDDTGGRGKLEMGEF